jgi:hypothetical protein
VTDPDADQLNITFYGRAVGAGSGTDFDLIVLPDTQNYSTLFPEIYTFQTQWISDHKSSSNIAFVAQVGDLVNLASSVPEYINADAAMDILDAGNIPYSVVPGNHDYNTYFGVSRFSGKAYYGGHYGVGNENNYSLFTASRMDFILINLEYQPTTQELDWADSLLKTYSNRRGIVVSHDILNLDNSWSYPALYHELKDNANLFLILCGHMHLPDDGAAIRTEIGDHGNKVYVLLSDYQDYPNGGDGYLRLLRFSPANDKIYVQTYSPYESAFMTDEQNQFELPYTMPDLGGFSVLGTINGVSSGETASLIWSGLANGQQYDWYTVASDGAFQTTSADWSFTTIDISTATTEPSPTVTSTLTSTLTFTPTTTATFTATATATYTLTNTATTTPTKTFTFTPTSTLTSTATRTLAATASNTPTLTMTPSPTDTLTSTATSTYTVAPSATITNTPAATSTSTPTPTLTRAPTSTATSTQTPTPTLTSTSTVTSTPSGTILFSPTANVAVNTNAGDNNGYEVSPGNAYLDDNLYARDVNSGTTTSTSCTTQGKDKHDFYNYGLNLPSSIVTGIVVRLNALTSSVTGSPKICVQLSWNGGLSWTSAKNTTTLTTGEQPYVLGGGTDTWGHAWTTSQLSDANFRVRVIDVASSISITFSLDRVAVQIYYR